MGLLFEGVLEIEIDLSCRDGAGTSSTVHDVSVPNGRVGCEQSVSCA